MVCDERILLCMKLKHNVGLLPEEGESMKGKRRTARERQKKTECVAENSSTISYKASERSIFVI